MRFFSSWIGCGLGLAAVPLMTVTAHASGDAQIDHVQSSHGRVDLLFSVHNLPAGVTLNPSHVSVTLDGEPVQAEVHSASTSTGTIRRTTVLALDVSQSMSGSQFRDAQQAALTFIDTAPADVKIGLVTFAEQVQLAHAPTADRAKLRDIVRHLNLSRGTSLYDGITTAVKAAGSNGLRDVVVLSDGQDETGASLSQLTRFINQSHSLVDVVSLGQRGEARAALEHIAGAGHGTLIDASKSGAMGHAFAGEAANLAGQLLVSFPVPPKKSATDASVAVTASAGGRQYSDSAVVTLSAATASESPSAHAGSTLPAVSGPAMMLGVVALGVSLLVLLLLAFGVLEGSGSNTIERRLAAYGPVRLGTGPTTPTSLDVSVRRAAVGVAEKALSDTKVSATLASRLDAAGIPMTPAEWSLLHLGSAVGGAFVGLLLGRGRLLLLLLFLVLGAALPWCYVTLKRFRRLKRFAAQLAPTLQVMSGSLSAGLSLAQSVETVAHEAGDPVRNEFRRAILEQRLGVEIETALDEVARRMESKDFSWVVMAVRIQRDVGGNLAELLDTVAGTLRERQYLRRQVSTLSAEGRLSAWIIGALPPVFVLYLELVRPEYLAPMLHTPLGLLMLAVAAVMMAVGVVWLNRIVKIEV